MTNAATEYAVPTVIRVTRSVNLSGNNKASDSTSDEIIEVHKFATQPALVNFNYPIKKALEYQSVGLEVGVTLPCYVEEIEAGFAKATELVIKRVKELLPEVDKVLDKLVEQQLESKNSINRGTWQARGR